MGVAPLPFTVGRNQPHRQELDETRRNKKCVETQKMPGRPWGKMTAMQGGVKRAATSIRFAFRGNRSNHTVVSARRKLFSFSCLEKSMLEWHKLFLFVTVCLLLSSYFLCTKHQCETSVAGTWRNVFAKSLGPCDTKTPPSMLSCSSAFCLFIYYSMGSSTHLCQTEYV